MSIKKIDATKIWIDSKGKHIEIHTMSNNWLNNIRKKFRGEDKIKPIILEIKRRKLKHKAFPLNTI